MSTLLFMIVLYLVYRFGHWRGERREARRRVTYVVVRQRANEEIPDSLRGWPL